ncbi:MAG: AAA family ATPase [Lunatimonas sp.]|uniref:AAA family ATPase n=1 Tax=Lunatimonas sp. TaxID=2060141 RepID=UPI00263A679D|nr:AAA family ATPase [Lunatimonas sp.]MCC5938645.1 AAA family ATPase [Lunatimonas sp.]
MNSIGFKNFRQFRDFPTTKLGPITYLVGKNNSGKSTIVKALLLISDFLKSGEMREFKFGNNVLEDANIVTFGRAKTASAEESLIAFETKVSNYRIEIQITGNDDDTNARVLNFLVEDLKSRFFFRVEPHSSRIYFGQGKTGDFIKEEEVPEFQMKTEIRRLEDRIRFSNLKKTDKEYLRLVDQLNSLKQKQNLFESNNEEQYEEYLNREMENIPENFLLDMPINWSYSLKENLEAAQKIAVHMHDVEFRNAQLNENTSSLFDEYRGFYQKKDDLRRSFEEYFESIQELELFYLGANPSKQSGLFTIRDKGNALSQSIHKFYQLGVFNNKGSESYRFLKKWMGKDGFDIGEDLTIKMYGGEAYDVKIKNGDGELSLADKGMGSIQAMLLLFRIASIIELKKSSSTNTKIIVEEPELNLHPNFQSKLADLFFEVWEKFDIEFIIETHSEYIIRKSQVIVSEKQLEDSVNENPFKVHYLDLHQSPSIYSIGFDSDGVLDRSFGSGFFDTAADTNLQLLKLKRIRNKQ